MRLILETWRYVIIGSGNNLSTGGTTPLPEPMLTYGESKQQEHIAMKFNQINVILFEEMCLKMLCTKMAASMSRPQSVKQYNKIGLVTGVREGYVIVMLHHKTFTLVFAKHMMHPLFLNNLHSIKNVIIMSPYTLYIVTGNLR